MATKNTDLSPMQQELLNRADAIFNSIGNAAGKASDLAIEGGKLVAEQVPDIAVQYITFGRAYLTLKVVLALALVVICIFTMIRVSIQNSLNLKDAPGQDWHFFRILTLLVCAVLCIFSAIAFMVNIREMMFVWFAPKMWLIQEIVHLARSFK